MIITGTITQAGQASEPFGQFNVRYQDITITDQQGREWVGRIGSKQGYPTDRPTPISITIEEKRDQNNEPYNYFRKYNPQDQGQQKAQPAQDETDGKVRHGLVCAGIQSGQIKVKGVLEFEYWKNYIVTGRAPLPPSKIPDPHPDITEEPAY